MSASGEPTLPPSLMRARSCLAWVVAAAIAIATLVALETPLVAIGFEIERIRHDFTHHVIRVDSVDWHYLSGGPSDAPVVVLLHGFGADKDNWLRFSSEIVDRYRVVVPDLPGFGDSSRDPIDYRLPAQSARLHRFLRAVGIPEPIHLVGNSMGGHIAILYALDHPKDVATLALFASAGVREPVLSPQTRLLARRINPMRIRHVSDFDRLLAFVTEVPPFIPLPAKRALARRAIADGPFHETILWSLIHDERAMVDERVETIACPTLVLWGDKDRAIDVSTAYVLHARIRTARLALMSGIGHLPMLEAPDRTAAHYVNFLSELGRPTLSAPAEDHPCE